MLNATRSITVFGVYLALSGLAFMFIPNVILPLFGFAPPAEVWIRVVGLLGLASGEATVLELAKPFAMSLPAISRHLKVLEHAGLISRTREAQWRPCRLEAAPLKEVADWVGHYRAFYEESLDRLDAYLKDLQSKEPTNEHTSSS